MQQGGLEKALRGLGVFTAVAYLIVGVAGAIWPGHWDDAPASDQIVGPAPHRGRARGARGSPNAAPCARSRGDARVTWSCGWGAPDLLGTPAASPRGCPDRA